MEHKSYFPGEISKKRAWFANYKEKIAIDGAALSMDAAAIAAEQAPCTAAIALIDEADIMQAAVQAKNTERDTQIKNSMDILRPAIRGHKANTGYTEDIGKDLKIIGSEVVVDYDTVKTTVRLAKVATGVDIKFSLENCEGGNVYCKRGAETAFTYLKTVTHPHSIDTRPNLGGALSEARQYYILLVVHDGEVGKASDITTINN